MKKLGFVLLIVLGGLLVSCGSTPPQRTIPSLPREVVAGSNESEVLVQNTSSLVNGLLNIFIDGEMVAQVDANGSERVIIPNGSHSIMVSQATADGTAGLTTNTVEFTANSKRIVFKTSSIYLPLVSPIFRVAKDGEFDLGTSQTTSRTSGKSTGIDGALERAAQSLTEGLKKDARIAIINISSGDTAQAEFITEEIEVLLVKGGFTVVDRRELDRIRKEQNFQLTGDVDDDSIVSLGKFAGADIVITGSVSGADSTRRLRLRALNTQTAQVMAAASEAF
ncbi:CsgG/HfaB family protein [Breznakiellaceae bacterium SP9]